jgi:adenylate cyclase
MPGERRADLAWEKFLGGRDPLLRLGRSVFRFLPSAPRCKLCLAPFRGWGAPLMRLIGKAPWERNPNVCKFCVGWLERLGPGGAEVDASVLVADVRGSTTMAESMAPRAYGELIGGFVEEVTGALLDGDAIIDKVVGDAVVAVFLPGFGGDAHARRAVDAARRVLAVTGHGTGEPRLPIGAGVSSGLTFVGSVGGEGSFTDFTALGDSVNTAARLAAEARVGEVLAAEATARRASLPAGGLERRRLELKGKAEAVDVLVLGAP